MPTSKMTSKGQVTIPIEVRKDMGVGTGSTLEFLPDKDRAWKVVRKKRSIMELAGFFELASTPISIPDMDVKLRQHAVKEHFAGEEN